MSDVKPGSKEEHPGLELGRIVQEKNIYDATLADATGLSRPLISQITNGNRRITSATAHKVCKVIGGDPMYWVKRQQEHDLWVKSKSFALEPAVVGS